MAEQKRPGSFKTKNITAAVAAVTAAVPSAPVILVTFEISHLKQKKASCYPGVTSPGPHVHDFGVDDLYQVYRCTGQLGVSHRV